MRAWENVRQFPVGILRREISDFLHGKSLKERADENHEDGEKKTVKSFVFGNIRVQFYGGKIIRVEYAKEGNFCDAPTFFIPSREISSDGGEDVLQKDGALCFEQYRLTLPEGGKSLRGVSLEKNGRRVYTYRKQRNSGELPALDRTPEVFSLFDTPRILIPEGGYSVLRKGEYFVEENVQDVYLLLCAKDARLLRSLYVTLTGRCELVRLSTLGSWNSKWYAYTESSARQLISDYERHRVPLDNMVLDTDWRKGEKGCGYEVNGELFPDMGRFLSYAHSRGVEIMFNDHPEPVDGGDVFSPEEIAFREQNLHALMDLGLDTWWYDRNWKVHLISPSPSLSAETLGLYLYQDIVRRYYERHSGKSGISRRPVIMGNVVNVKDGRYKQIEDSASHRYSIQWTGDILSDHDTFRREVATLIRTGNNCVAYCNGDCGGHSGDPDKELFVRWMQFGALSPVLRPHSTKNVKRSREPWVYDEETLDIVRGYICMRYRLLPVIYRYAFENNMTGLPVFASPGIFYPKDKKALKTQSEYMLGEDILICPVTKGDYLPVGKENFLSPVQATYYDGIDAEGESIAFAQYRMLDMELDHVSPEKGVPVYNFSARFETDVQFSEDTELVLRCDDGAAVYLDGEKIFEDKTLHSALYFPLKKVAGNVPHRLKIVYFQAGEEAAIGLYRRAGEKDEKTAVYLPQGKWLDVFDGKVYAGGRTLRKKYALQAMPLFVRTGGAYSARP